MGSDNTILRKILIMTFDDNYIKNIGKIISRKKIFIDDEIGFVNYENENKNIIYTFLSSKNRRTWLHHFVGAYGIIIINEGLKAPDDINEIENIFKSKVLEKKPLLLLYDKKKILQKDYKHLEDIRYLLLNKNINFNVQYIDFKVNHGNSELLYGLHWLDKQIFKI